MMQRRIPSLEKAIEIYWNNLSLGNKEIMELFGVKRGTATRIKNEVIEALAEMRAKGDVRAIRNEPHRVPTKKSYDIWELDITEIEKMVNRARKLRENAESIPVIK